MQRLKAPQITDFYNLWTWEEHYSFSSRLVVCVVDESHTVETWTGFETTLKSLNYHCQLTNWLVGFLFIPVLKTQFPEIGWREQLHLYVVLHFARQHSCISYQLLLRHTHSFSHGLLTRENLSIIIPHGFRILSQSFGTRAEKSEIQPTWCFLCFVWISGLTWNVLEYSIF